MIQDLIDLIQTNIKAGYDFKKNIIDGINDIKYFYEKGLIKNDEKTTQLVDKKV